MSKLSLFKLSNQLKEIQENILKAEGEISLETEALLEKVEQEITLKTDGVVEWMDSLKSKIEQADHKIEQLKMIKERIKKTMASFDGYVLNCMDNLEKTKIEGDLRSVSIRKPVQVVEIEDETDIPLDYITVETKKIIKINKMDIKKDLKAGKSVPGAKLSFGKRSVTYK